MKVRVFAMTLIVPGNVQAQTPAVVSVPSQALPEDLNLIVGKRVVPGRLPLCAPRTYAADLTFAGQLATVTGYKPNPALAHLGNNLNRLPASSRAMMIDAQRGGTLSFKFDDGTLLDTCGDLLLSQLAAGLELAPGQVLTPASLAAPQTGDAPAAGPQECPMVVARVSSGMSLGHMVSDALTTSTGAREVDEAVNGTRNYLDLQFRNASSKAVRAWEFTAAYRNSMGDETISPTFVSQNPQPIAPGAISKASTMDRSERSQTGRGEVRVFVSRVRFADDTTWQDNGSRSCSAAAISK